MLTDYFQSRHALERMRGGRLGPYLDDFTDAMSKDGFVALTIREHVRSVVHLARWMESRDIDLARWDDGMLPSFRRYLARRRLVNRDRAHTHAVQFVAFLRAKGLIKPRAARVGQHRAAILVQFESWMRRHRGVVPHTLDRYGRALAIFLSALGEDPATYDVARIRAFVVAELGRRGRSETREAVTAIRSFLRFLVAEGRVAPGIEQCVPTVPQWRLSSLPRYLEASDLQRVVDSCDQTTGHGLRDHAILLLLSRLGLRAGDIVAMTVDDIDWRHGTLRVKGKSQREAVLPLPQDVGDAIVAYLKRGRPRSDSTRVFLTVMAPTRPFASSAAVSDIVRFALARAGIRNPPNRGAHLLRHSAATAMLRAGSSLDTIATVMRHRSSDTTAYYAKVDVAMLREIAQPWPGKASC